MDQPATRIDRNVRHRSIELDGITCFYREAGPPSAPVVLLPHGYPCSSFEFRNYMPALADRWRLLAPDFPGSGYTEAPDDFRPHFDSHAAFLERFVDALSVARFTIYLHDFGSQIGLRLAIRKPERISALVIQNGDIYEDALGPKYAAIKRYWSNPSAENRAVLERAVSEEGFRDEFVGEVDEDVAACVPPDLWKLHWPLMDTGVRREMAVRLMEGLKENLAWFPRYQSYLREHQPPTLILWGPRDGYMPAEAGRAYLRDLPNAELHMFEDAGHWLLETHLDTAVPIIRDFLARVLR